MDFVAALISVPCIKKYEMNGVDVSDYQDLPKGGPFDEIAPPCYHRSCRHCFPLISCVAVVSESLSNSLENGVYDARCYVH